MRFKGNTSYQTVTGGMCSLITTVLVAWFTLVQAQQLLKLEDPKIVRNDIYHKSSEMGTRTAEELHFDLAVGIRS